MPRARRWMRDAGRTEPRRQVGGGQRREFADRRQPPALQDVERPRCACRSASRRRDRPRRVGAAVDLPGELLKDREWNVAQRHSGIAGRDRDATAGAGQQDRRGLRDGDGNLRRAGTREMLGYRLRVAEQPLQARHIEHDRPARMPLEARRKLPRDRHQPVGRPIGSVQGGVEITGVTWRRTTSGTRGSGLGGLGSRDVWVIRDLPEPRAPSPEPGQREHLAGRNVGNRRREIVVRRDGHDSSRRLTDPRRARGRAHRAHGNHPRPDRQAAAAAGCARCSRPIRPPQRCRRARARS